MRRLLFGFSSDREELLKNIGLLVVRLGVGLNMMLGHGLGKLGRLGDDPIKFADPFGFGPAFTLGFAVLAEFFCSMAVTFGFLTRLAAIPPIITMSTAVLIIHRDDPWQKQEFALMYLISFLVVFLAGPGRFSVDGLIKKKLNAGNSES